MTDHTEILEGLMNTLDVSHRAAQQYSALSQLCQKLGLNQLGDFQQQSVDGEQILAEKLANRIRNLQTANSSRAPVHSHSIQGILESNLAIERANLRSYQKLLILSRRCEDWETYELMESSVLDSEDQIERLESELDFIDEFGVEVYLHEHSQSLPVL
ncbi:hypothetical protein KIH39_14210 [Telmatocola sphagniphila]|uniref:Ferritin-like diiron domain-containing protein n=1 Tax=Telmatocola sphagniphila TaxID=1123043 RepID=A0A8E6ES20_9BACT|nr:ferritin-like domain-containing protein [Telmatocola sphagniphila]QVL30019.1 hypothetical protein KIH39_14210 [Telmatocola sphagniphila]